MGCIENLKYEMILPLGASFRECREYAEKNFNEVWYVDPGYRSSTNTSSASRPSRLGWRAEKSSFRTQNPVMGPTCCCSKTPTRLNACGRRRERKNNHLVK